MTTETNSNENQGSILDRATIVSIAIGKLGIRRKVESRRMEVKDTTTQPDADCVKVSKEIIDCQEYDQIVSLDNETRGTILKMAVPSQLRSGAYLVPDTMLDEVDRILEEYQARRIRMIDAFVDVYQTAQQDARGKLATLYDPRDYPPAEQVRASFTVRVRYESWGTPARLESINDRIYRRERDRATVEIREASEEIRGAMRLACKELVDHLVDVLTPGPDGKARIFRDTTIENLTGFLDTFSARNIAQDGDLERLVSQAREVLAGTTPDDLRRAPLARTMVRQGLTQVREQLAQLTETRGRRFRFDDPAAGPPSPAAPDATTTAPPAA